MTEILSHGSIVNRLIALDADELLISSRRRALHRTIDALYLSAPLDDRQIAELDRLEDEEHEISAQRQRVHTTINKLRGALTGWEGP